VVEVLHVYGVFMDHALEYPPNDEVMTLGQAIGQRCWKYALEPTGFDPLVGSDGFDLLWCRSPNGPKML
jgi:hypothetical protein